MADELMAPPAAPTDVFCWLWAAFPPYQGHLNISAAARGLDVSRSTVRRWLTHRRLNQLGPGTARRITQRAILRGRGTYLWPDLADDAKAVTATRLDRARQGAQIAEAGGTLPDNWVGPHTVLITHYHRAHAWAVTIAAHEKTPGKVYRHGIVHHTWTAPNMPAAQVIKLEALTRANAHRCTIPAALVETGRTDTCRDTPGILEVLTQGECSQPQT